MSTRTLCRATVAAVSLAAALAASLPASAVTTSVAPSTSASSAPDYQHRAALAARWQGSQLTKGRIHNRQFGFDDWGLTVDTGFTLAADGSQPVRLARLEQAVRNHYGDYTSYQGAKYAGAIAKVLLFVRVVRDDPRDFGGVNVRKQLLNRAAPSGRLSDKGSTDYSNVLGQSYGVLGLSRTGGVPQRVVDYLLRQRCGAGYFRLQEIPGETCRQSGSAPDIDATALALQALLSARQHGATVPAGTTSETASWLVSRQHHSGSFGGGQLGPNTNSTGLVANALAATDHRRARLRAADYVAELQITKAKAGGGPAAKDIGAIAYKRAALASALSDGITSTTRDQFRRATPQAYFALAPAPLNRLLAPRLNRLLAPR